MWEIAAATDLLSIRLSVGGGVVNGCCHTAEELAELLLTGGKFFSTSTASAHNGSKMHNAESRKQNAE